MAFPTLFFSLLTAVPAFAQDQSARAAQSPLGFLFTFFPVLAFVAIFYFLLYRPQQQANRKRQDMLSALKKSDRVLTTGGMYGTILNIRGEILDLRVADNLKVEVNRGYVANVIAVANGSPASRLPPPASQ